MGIVLLFARPFDQAVEIVTQIAPPMVLANPIGAALFMAVLDHQESSRRVEIVLQQSQLALLVRSRLDDSRLRSRSWCLLRRASGLP
jgi:LytS/YehU family sensor histidine kinase